MPGGVIVDNLSWEMAKMLNIPGCRKVEMNNYSGSKDCALYGNFQCLILSEWDTLNFYNYSTYWSSDTEYPQQI
ncbi:unnamed protein product [Fusarium graminearum]|uniref:Chromosome 3, complete genome n=1 Tax=Gibberella zeae (strain ATCC MYA-4620 / CBS 123657 / FGSC 9075 / NRRL 31084 / PH-1) TaxID=229533 RepID=A0A098E1G9_GIBZE|nr:unnamed protein product [Fusarium graminearum]